MPRDDWDPCPMMKPLKEEPGLAGVGQGRTVGFGVSFWCLEASSPHSPGPQGPWWDLSALSPWVPPGSCRATHRLGWQGPHGIPWTGSLIQTGAWFAGTIPLPSHMG